MSLAATLTMGAGLLAGPSWLETPFISFRDYPTQAVQNKWSAAVVMELLIGPDGKVSDCTPIAGFGSEDFASMFCEIASRKRASPANDIDGNPTFGIRLEFVKLLLLETPQGKLIADLPALRPDIELEVQRLPGATDPSVDTKVLVAVDEGGNVVACKPEADAQVNYADAACGEVMGTRLQSVSDETGKPIAYVRSLSVRFVVAGGGAMDPGSSPG